jgi:hypothetical protein
MKDCFNWNRKNSKEILFTKQFKATVNKFWKRTLLKIEISECSKDLIRVIWKSKNYLKSETTKKCLNKSKEDLKKRICFCWKLDRNGLRPTKSWKSSKRTSKEKEQVASLNIMSTVCSLRDMSNKNSCKNKRSPLTKN